MPDPGQDEARKAAWYAYIGVDPATHSVAVNGYFGAGYAAALARAEAAERERDVTLERLATVLGEGRR